MLSFAILVVPGTTSFRPKFVLTVKFSISTPAIVRRISSVFRRHFLLHPLNERLNRVVFNILVVAQTLHYIILYAYTDYSL